MGCKANMCFRKATLSGEGDGLEVGEKEGRKTGC